jgi:hypothetical protein
MSVQTPVRPVGTPTARTGHDVAPTAATALGWLAGGAALAFTVAWVGTTLLGLQHDVFYLIYFTAALGYLGWVVSRTAVWREVITHNAWWSLAAGALVAVAVVRQVMAQPGTTHPDGAFFGFEVVWRGLVYGAVDMLVLVVFPAVVAYVVMRGNRSGLRRKAGFAGLLLVLSLGVSAAYHLGYSTYRGSELAKPLIGTAVMDLPAMLTGNPVGALVAHPAVHTAATVHQYYGGDGTNHYLPPELSADYPDRPDGFPAVALAAGWVTLTGAALAVGSGRLRRSA